MRHRKRIRAKRVRLQRSLSFENLNKHSKKTIYESIDFERTVLQRVEEEDGSGPERGFFGRQLDVWFDSFGVHD